MQAEQSSVIAPHFRQASGGGEVDASDNGTPFASPIPSPRVVDGPAHPWDVGTSVVLVHMDPSTRLTGVEGGVAAFLPGPQLYLIAVGAARDTFVSARSHNLRLSQPRGLESSLAVNQLTAEHGGDRIDYDCTPVLDALGSLKTGPAIPTADPLEEIPAVSFGVAQEDPKSPEAASTPPVQPADRESEKFVSSSRGQSAAATLGDGTQVKVRHGFIDNRPSITDLKEARRRASDGMALRFRGPGLLDEQSDALHMQEVLGSVAAQVAEAVPLCRHGISPPFSTAPPSETDLEKAAALQRCLDEEDPSLASAVDARENFSASLCQAIARYLPGCRLFPGWETQCGVESMDAAAEVVLCVAAGAPDQYEAQVCAIASTVGGVLEVLLEGDFEVPEVVARTVCGTVKLVCVRLAHSCVPESVVDSEFVLDGLGAAAIRAVDKARFGARVLSLIPKPCTFRIVMRFIRLWASRRGLLGPEFGFLSLEAVAILVGRACQWYPTAAPSLVASRFFKTFEKWNWNRAVMLDYVQAEAVGAQVAVQPWQPPEKAEDGEALPVVTPSYPSWNAGCGINAATKRIIKKELRRGMELSGDVYRGHRGWGDIVAPLSFKTSRRVLRLDLIAAEKPLLRVWQNFFLVHLLSLIAQAETTTQGKQGVRVWPQWFPCPDLDSAACGSIFIACDGKDYITPAVTPFETHQSIPGCFLRCQNHTKEIPRR